MDQRDTVICYIHGKGGNAVESEWLRPLFPNCDVVGPEYTAATPWEARAEFPAAWEAFAAEYPHIILIANSIGAYFSMCALPQERIEKAYFISPIVDMERLILDMLGWAGQTEAALEQMGEMETEFGETLSWAYLSYVRRHPAEWRVPTKIAYGAQDSLTSKETISAFAAAHQADLSILEQGAHWFHTEEEMAFLRNWITEGEKMDFERKMQ